MVDIVQQNQGAYSRFWAVINVARLHAYRQGVFWLVDVPKEEAKKRQQELSREGWIVTHTELV